MPGPAPTPISPGERFGKWIVVCHAGRRSGKAIYECRCVCGATRLVSQGHLRGGTSKSCRSCGAKRHGHAPVSKKTPEYVAWCNMRRRCSEPDNKSYRYYGARGIRVCDRWRSFEAFLDDMGPKPGPEYSIDRIDNDGHYEPGNCRWATAKQQSDNKRRPAHWRAKTKSPQEGRAT